MNFFDSFIQEVKQCISVLPEQEFSPADPWQDLGQQQMILRRDTAFELEGVGFNLVTSAEIPNSIVLVGDDLNRIRSNRRFARISLVQIQDDGDAQAAYDLIKKIDYVKYHIFPEGYMMRSSSRSHQEAVRISQNAIESGITFQRIGSMLIEKYQQIPAVKGISVIFVTAPDADYRRITGIAEKSHGITETLNHVMNHMEWDCSTCNLKAICDEVEGMKALHFSQASGT